MTKKLRAQVGGFTLIELVIALSIFGVIMIIASDSFINVIRNNRESVNEQNIQDHARFLYEMMLKEIKMAKIDDVLSPTCVGSSDKMYSLVSDASGQSLTFKNYLNQCVTYRFDSTTKKMQIRRDGASFVSIFPKEIEVEDVSFSITNLTASTTGLRHFPPSVTLSLRIKSIMWKQPVLQLQSTVSARYLE